MEQGILLQATERKQSSEILKMSIKKKINSDYHQSQGLALGHPPSAETL